MEIISVLIDNALMQVQVGMVADGLDGTAYHQQKIGQACFFLAAHLTLESPSLMAELLHLAAIDLGSLEPEHQEVVRDTVQGAAETLRTGDRAPLLNVLLEGIDRG